MFELFFSTKLVQIGKSNKAKPLCLVLEVSKFASRTKFMHRLSPCMIMRQKNLLFIGFWPVFFSNVVQFHEVKILSFSFAELHCFILILYFSSNCCNGTLKY